MDKIYTFCPNSESNWYRHWGHDTLKFEDIQHLETMTFEFTLHRLFNARELQQEVFAVEIPRDPSQPATISLDSSNEAKDPKEESLEEEKLKETDKTLDIPPSPMATETFTWTVEDEETVKAIHNAPNVWGFWSPIWSMHGFKWFLALYPDGSRLGEVLTCERLRVLHNPFEHQQVLTERAFVD